MAKFPDFEKLTKCCFIPQRVIISLFGFMCAVNAYTMRVCLSMAINSIVVPINRTNATSEAVCPKISDSSPGPVGGDYEWSQRLQGFILSSFYVGYVISHIPGGILADRYGAKWILSTGMLFSVMGTLLTPLIIVTCGPYVLMVTRVIIGLGQGVVYPSLSVLVSNWAPPKERGVLGALVMGGGPIGTIVSNSMSGVIIHTWNWSVVFYVFGFTSLLWYLFFIMLCYNTPQVHPCIKRKEVEYLESQITYQDKTNKKTPWKAILRNGPVYALISAQFGHDWALFTMVTDLPIYMAQVMRFDIKSNGFVSSLPYLVLWIVSIISGVISDVLLKKELISVTMLRKIYTGIAAIGPGLFMVLASYAKCNHILVVALFTISMGLMGPFYSGLKLTPIDMAPNFSGILSALSNGLASFAGILAPSVVGLITTHGTLAEWRLVFWLAFLIITITTVVFFIWGSSKVQPFNEYSNDSAAKTN